MTPSPTFRATKRHLVEAMNKTIVKFSKSIYNQQASPNYISLLEKMNLRQESSEAEKGKTQKTVKKSEKKSERKFKFEGLQILNLPRLPYGKHVNYEENDFMHKHFVDVNEDKDIEEVKSLDRQFRLQRKFARKGQRQTNYSTNFKDNLEKYLVFKLEAGELKCRKEESVIKQYDSEKNKFRLESTFRELDWKEEKEKKKRQRIRKLTTSVHDIREILRFHNKTHESQPSPTNHFTET